MKEVNWGSVVLLVVFITFVALPIAAAGQVFVLSESDILDQTGLLIGGICILLAIPLLFAALLGLRRLQD